MNNRTLRDRCLMLTKATWEVVKLPELIKLTLPLNLPSLNVWKNWHWSKQGRYKKQLTADLTTLFMIAKVPTLQKAKILVVHYFPTNRQRDDDNAVPKFLGDALKGAGFIAEDNSKVLEWMRPEFKEDKDNFRTEVFIYERP